MATIKNINSSIEIVFSILKSKNDKWLNYRIEVYSLYSDSNKKLLMDDFSLVNEHDLFLDAFYEPEIPLLAEGIRNILSHGSDFFSFTPIDEKDFILELTRTDKMDVFALAFFVDNKMSNIWQGIKIMVNKLDLIEFTNTLIIESKN